jgi:molecular chaperone DnaJ
LGGEIEVPTLAGKQNLKIPGGTQSGKIFRVRGQGVKSVRGSEIGDLMVKVHVETPVNLTAEQKELLSRLEETLAQGDSKHSPKPSSWLGGVKDFFERMTS